MSTVAVLNTGAAAGGGGAAHDAAIRESATETSKPVPPRGLEPRSSAPEADTLSTELRGRDVRILSNTMAGVSAVRDREMTLMEHLAELRTRLMIAAFAVLITTVLSFVFTGQIIRWLLLPAGDIKLLAIEPTETFTSFFRVALYSGIAFAMPVILYEIYRYIDPALHPQERRFVLAIGLPVLGLFALGLAFCYYLILPPAIGFLFSFGGDIFEVKPRASAYLSFVTTFMLAMGI